MGTVGLRGAREPLEHEYEENPEAARITPAATGAARDGVRGCTVDIGRAIDEAERHEGAGGPGAGARSGDHLSGALAACSQPTARVVAENVGIDVDGTVETSGAPDLHGTMGVDDTVPVGVEDIRLDRSVDGELDEETRAALEKDSEEYRVVYQTRQHPPAVDTTWTVHREMGGQVLTYSPR